MMAQKPQSQKQTAAFACKRVRTANAMPKYEAGRADECAARPGAHRYICERRGGAHILQTAERGETMPFKPKRPCRFPGCPNLTDTGAYCAAHRSRVPAQTAPQKERERRYDNERGTAAERGYNSKWRTARQGYLAHHPLCAECQRHGRITPATVVDHMIPHKGDKKLFWDRDNWQPLCKACHDAKTAREDGGFGNPQTGGR